MSGTALDHQLVRDYLRELDAAMRGLPAAQARELKEQITAHLDDALEPAADDHEVAATLRRLGSPADLAAEARAGAGASAGAEAGSGSSGPPLALSRPAGALAARRGRRGPDGDRRGARRAADQQRREQ